MFYDNLALTQADGGTHRELGCPIAIMCHVLCASERGYYHHNAHLARINNKRRSCQQRTCA